MPLSSTLTLRSLFGSGVAGDSPIGGSGDLGLVGLAGVVSHGSGGVEDAAALEDDGALPGSGIDVSSTSLRGVVATLSSSGSGSGLSCTSDLPEVLVASRTVSDLAFESADLGGGSR